MTIKIEINAKLATDFQKKVALDSLKAFISGWTSFTNNNHKKNEVIVTQFEIDNKPIE